VLVICHGCPDTQCILKRIVWSSWNNEEDEGVKIHFKDPCSMLSNGKDSVGDLCFS